MIEMVRRFLRQKIGSLGTLIALGLLALFEAVPLNTNQGFGIPSRLAVLLLAAGCISRDVSSGAIQMILSRPLKRSEYLFGRYFGTLLAFAGFLITAVAVAFLLGRLVLRMGPLSEIPAFSWAAAGRGVIEALFAGALLAAIVLFFSTFLRGWGDVLALVLAMILLGFMQAAGSALNKPALVQAGRVAYENLYPKPDWSHILAGQDIVSGPTSQYFLALACYLALAALVFNRREFSYGQD
jgi:ABC-type transport system involved in multi-copper enzyme maturation permease subunit